MASELLLEQARAIEERDAAGLSAADPAPSCSQIIPKFCKCGRCFTMATKMENVCCRKCQEPGDCVLIDKEMATVVLNHNVVRTAVNTARELYADDLHPSYDNNRMRFQAYHQFVMATAGYTGSGNRIVVPSCVVSHD